MAVGPKLKDKTGFHNTLKIEVLLQPLDEIRVHTELSHTFCSILVNILLNWYPFIYLGTDNVEKSFLRKEHDDADNRRRVRKAI